MADQRSSASAFAAIPQRQSLVSLAAESLKAHLRAGHWPERLPSERDLCACLQVSRPTIRAALQALERQRVIELDGKVRRVAAIRRHDKAADGPDRPRVVRILTAWPLERMASNALFVLGVLREQLAKLGYTIDTHADPQCFQARPARALERLVQGRPAAAWVAWGSKEPMQRWFVEHGVPIAIAGSCRPEIPLPSLDIDFHATCKHAADLLWRKGHRRMALVVQKDAYGGDIDSEYAFREAMAQHARSELCLIRHDGSRAHLCSLLDRGLRAASPPTAYFVVRPVHALTVLTHLLRSGVRIPEDAAVLSRDDESYLQHTSPELSRYGIDSQQLARKLCGMVKELAESGAARRRALRLIPELIPGETV